MKFKLHAALIILCNKLSFHRSFLDESLPLLIFNYFFHLHFTGFYRGAGGQRYRIATFLGDIVLSTLLLNLVKTDYHHFHSLDNHLRRKSFANETDLRRNTEKTKTPKKPPKEEKVQNCHKK